MTTIFKLNCGFIPNAVCLAKYFNIYVFLYIASCISFWYFYQIYPILGIYLVIATFFIALFTSYFVGYNPPSMLKIGLVLISAFIVSIATLFQCVESFANQSMTNLLRLNIFIFCFSIREPWIRILLLICVLFTPIITVQNHKLFLQPFILPVDTWILFQTVVLMILYLYSSWFCNIVYFAVIALILPLLFHFTENRWLETRLYFLCISFWFIVFQNNRKTLKQIYRDFAFY